MCQPPIEESAGQVGEAFGAAFPKLKMPQQQQQQQQPQTRCQSATGTKASRTESAPCPHIISSTLTPIMSDPHIRPVCTMTNHVEAIQDVQRDFADRGGLFASKDMAQHKTRRQRWRNVRIHAMKTVTAFEKLQLRPNLCADDARQLKDALDIWERKKIALTRVPGMVYAPGAEEDEPTDEEHEVARLMMDLLTAVLDKETTKNDKKPLPPEEYHEKSGGHPIEPLIITGCARSSNFIAETRKDTRPPLPAFSSDSQNKPTHSPSHADHPTTGPQPPKSILKRRCSSALVSTPQKRLRVTNDVAVSAPHLNTTNQSPFNKLPSTTTFQPHAKHTFAAHKRLKRAFRRGTWHYKPGAWASGAHEKKAETSGHRRSWADFEDDVMREMEEEEGERALMAGLKVVIGTWTVGWWVRRVLNVLDLREVKSMMEVV